MVEVFGAPLSGINARAGYMFQAESLMPWRTALANVMAGLEFRGACPTRESVRWSGSCASAWGLRRPLPAPVERRHAQAHLLAQTLALTPTSS